MGVSVWGHSWMVGVLLLVDDWRVIDLAALAAILLPVAIREMIPGMTPIWSNNW